MPVSKIPGAGISGGSVVVNQTAPDNSLVVDSSGNVGIGTSSPLDRLDVVSGSGTYRNRIRNSNANEALLLFQNSSTGTTTVDGFLTGMGGGGEGYLWNWENQPIQFGTNGTERMRITSGGSLLVGATAAQDAERLGVYRTDNERTFQVRNSVAGLTTNIVSLQASGTNAGTGFNFIQCEAGSGFNAQFRVRGDGTIFAQNTTVQSISDERLKENITNATDGLGVISALRPVRFDFKEGFGNEKKNQLGFIAQEVEQVFPEAVDVWGDSDDSENPYKSVGTGALIPVLVKAIQEQQQIINDLKARIETLEAK